MAISHPIRPFPSHIDRSHFGSWFSGFVDGEGHFGLRWGSQSRPRIPQAVGEFILHLREDDLDILFAIHAYLGVGTVKTGRHRTGPSKPIAEYRVSRATDMATVLVPQFTSFPLLAKKRRDFDIWKQGVDLLYRKTKTLKRSKGFNLGHQSHWTAADLDEFGCMVSALRDIRRYKSTLDEISAPHVFRRPVDAQRSFLD